MNRKRENLPKLPVMYQNYPSVISIDYNSILHLQSDRLQRSKRLIAWYILLSSLPSVIYKFFLLKNRFKKIVLKASQQLLSAKGMNIQLHQEYDHLENQQTSHLIESYNTLLRSTIEVLGDLESLSSEMGKWRFKEIGFIIEIVKETIESYYDSIRLLKRKNLITPIETTQLAKDIALISTHSLQKTTYGN